jgi:uncharacterized protein (UPF0335 family)
MTVKEINKELKGSGYQIKVHETYLSVCSGRKRRGRNFVLLWKYHQSTSPNRIPKRKVMIP